MSSVKKCEIECESKIGGGGRRRINTLERQGKLCGYRSRSRFAFAFAARHAQKRLEVFTTRRAGVITLLTQLPDKVRGLRANKARQKDVTVPKTFSPRE